MNREEAIKIVKRHYPANKQMLNGALEFLIPELKVSEDERIREVLVDYFKRYKGQEERGGSTMFCGIPTDDIITWFEKQGEQKPTDKIHLGKEYKCIASPRYSTFMTGKIYKPEDKFLCSLMNFCSDCFEPIEDSEQIDLTFNTDKVEPKFKDGDWIVYKDAVWKVCNIGLQNYYDLLKINNEVSTRLIKDVDKEAHLWTIDDAKDGDILTSCINETFIYNGCLDEHCVSCYCGLNIGGQFYTYGISGRKRIWSDNKDITPATKGQCDFLFQKMKEVGYEWDAENKKLTSL